MARQPLEIPPPDFLSIDVVKLAVPAFIILIVAEAVYGRITGKATYEPRDTAASLLMGVGNLVVKILAAGLFAGIGVWLYQHRLFDIGYTWWALVLAFFAEDLAYYWFHRIAHERRWFWASRRHAALRGRAAKNLVSGSVWHSGGENHVRRQIHAGVHALSLPKVR